MGSLRHAPSVVGARRLSVAIAAGLLVGACSGERVLGDYPPSSCDLAEPPENVADAPLSVATFWAGDGREREAFQTLYDRIDQDRYAPAQETMTSRVDAQRRITAAFDLQRLPDVFQVNGGNDVLRWVDGRDAESTDVCALDSLRETYEWQAHYFEAALEPLTCRGKLYGLPVGIHHLNVLFYNRRLFAELQQAARERQRELVDPSELGDVGSLLELLNEVSDLSPKTPDGKSIVPLSIGAQSEWPLTIVAFENVLLSLGDEAYETLWQRGVDRDDEASARSLRRALERMVERLRELAAVSNLEQRIGWQAALRQVEAGEALMTVTGDWGWAQLSDTAAERVATVDFPGTSSVIVYTPDSFAVPREVGKNGFPARYFLHDIVESKEAVLEFSAMKHSIPARNDLTEAEVERLPTESLRERYRRFRACDGNPDCKRLLAVSGLGPAPGTDPCVDEIDALLTLAVSGVVPPQEVLDARRCDKPFPLDRDGGAERLLDLLMSIAGRRYAVDCR